MGGYKFRDGVAKLGGMVTSVHTGIGTWLSWEGWVAKFKDGVVKLGGIVAYRYDCTGIGG
jgi:hypothetical protein